MSFYLLELPDCVFTSKYTAYVCKFVDWWRLCSHTVSPWLERPKVSLNSLYVLYTVLETFGPSAILRTGVNIKSNAKVLLMSLFSKIQVSCST